MKKSGYTLAETLIALGIVGVISAITLPMVNKYTPDTNKLMYLNTYDSINKQISIMLNNSNMYPLVGPCADESDEMCNYSNTPLFNSLSVYTRKNSDGTISLFQGPNRFAALFALSGGFMDNDDAAKLCRLGFNEGIYNSKPLFTTKNGVDFWITTNHEATSTGGKYKTLIYIDVNGQNKGKNCQYSNECKNPDTYKLAVDAKGKLFAMDEIGASYLKNRSTTKKVVFKPSGNFNSNFEENISSEDWNEMHSIAIKSTTQQSKDNDNSNPVIVPLD